MDGLDPNWWDEIIMWFDSWPVDTAILEWVGPRVVILYALLTIVKAIAKVTPWGGDNAVVAVIESVLGMFTRGNKAPGPKTPAPEQTPKDKEIT